MAVVPTEAGFWVPWSPLALPQRWPFCWWVAVAIDHFSRRAMGVASFDKEPTSEQVRAFLGRTMASSPRQLAGEGPGVRAPKYIVCDKGVQFWNDGFKRWCKRKNIKPRFGAIGKHGSIAVVERFILTLKTLLGCLLLIPYRRERFQQELSAIVEWYNQHRPHEWFGGKTPDEVYSGWHPANRKPRFEVRFALAAQLDLCQALGIGARQPRRKTDDGSQLLPRTEAPARCRAQAGSLSNDAALV